MDLFDAIAQRHSYRGAFQDEPPSREDLRRMIEAGLQAPSGCNAQTTTFVAVDNPDLIRRINEMPKANAAVRNGRAFIACIIERQPPAVYKAASFQVEDCAAAVENILLAITALGYASVWIDGWLRVDNRAETIGALLGIPDGKVVRVLLPIGRPADTVQRPPRKSFEERAWFNRYGA